MLYLLYNVYNVVEENFMSVLEGVLREELARLSANISAYKEKLKNLPKGTIFIRKDYNSYFVYRKRREGSKILSEYIGPLESLRAQEEMDKSNEYRKIKKNIKIAQEELIELKKAVKVYDRKRKAS